MKILSWKCQGIGNPRTVRALKKLIASHQPDIVFLMETKQLSIKMTFFTEFYDYVQLKNCGLLHH
jgi:exonuclease III